MQWPFAFKSLLTSKTYTPQPTEVAVPIRSATPPVALPVAAPALDLGFTTIIIYVAGDVEITSKINNLIVQRR